VKDAWSKIATETASDVQTKEAREQAKTWITGKLTEQRAAALTTVQSNNKTDLEEAREVRRAFSSLLQFGFWPQLVSDAGFRGIVEESAQALEVDRNIESILAGASSQAVRQQIESDISKLQQWMGDQNRDYNIPRQTRAFQQVIDRLERAQELFLATTQ